MGVSRLKNSVPCLRYSPALDFGGREPVTLEEDFLKVSRLWIKQDLQLFECMRSFFFFFLPSGRKYELVERWRVEILWKFCNPKITFWKKKFYFEIISNLQKSCRNSTQDSYMSNQIPQVLVFCHIYLIVLIVIFSLSLCIYVVDIFVFSWTI